MGSSCRKLQRLALFSILYPFICNLEHSFIKIKSHKQIDDTGKQIGLDHLLAPRKFVFILESLNFTFSHIPDIRALIFYLRRYNERSRDYQSCCCCGCDIFIFWKIFKVNKAQILTLVLILCDISILILIFCL